MAKLKNAESKAAAIVHAHECRIRDEYAKSLETIRPLEKLVSTATRFKYAPLVADMLTTDKSNTLRIWEFKQVATYDSLGQVLVYLAYKRLDSLLSNVDSARVGKFKDIRAVLAAFEFKPEVEVANTVLNLGVELVTIPRKFAGAGYVPPGTPKAGAPKIPSGL